jgi:hypothetical protein
VQSFLDVRCGWVRQVPGGSALSDMSRWCGGSVPQGRARGKLEQAVMHKIRCSRVPRELRLELWKPTGSGQTATSRASGMVPSNCVWSYPRRCGRQENLGRQSVSQLVYPSSLPLGPPLRQLTIQAPVCVRATQCIVLGTHVIIQACRS